MALSPPAALQPDAPRGCQGTAATLHHSASLAQPHVLEQGLPSHWPRCQSLSTQGLCPAPFRFLQRVDRSCCPRMQNWGC